MTTGFPISLTKTENFCVFGVFCLFFASGGNNLILVHSYTYMLKSMFLRCFEHLKVIVFSWKESKICLKGEKISGLGFKPITFISGIAKMISELVSKILLIQEDKNTFPLLFFIPKQQRYLLKNPINHCTVSNLTLQEHTKPNQ